MNREGKEGERRHGSQEMKAKRRPFVASSNVFLLIIEKLEPKTHTVGTSLITKTS